MYDIAQRVGVAKWKMTVTLEHELHFPPCVPADSKSFEVPHRYRETVCHLTVLQTYGADGGTMLTIDGVEQSGPAVALVNDRQQRRVEMRLRGISN
jgi:cyclic beta-1,2-glucan synthetase